MITEDEGIDLLVKIVIIGDTGVGKTNLLLRYLRDEFEPHGKPTIGVDFFAKTATVNYRQLKIQFFDTAGQEKYRSICSTYYKNANGVILVYDVTDRATFENLGRWLQELRTYLSSETKVLMVGNKIDLAGERQISSSEGKHFAVVNNCFFMETSALTNEENCVAKAFDIVIKEISIQIAARMEHMEESEYENVKNKVETVRLNKKGVLEGDDVVDSGKCKC